VPVKITAAKKFKQDGGLTTITLNCKVSKKEAYAWQKKFAKLSARQKLIIEYQRLKKSHEQATSDYNRWRVEQWRIMADKLESLENQKDSCMALLKQIEAMPEDKKKRKK
jgi:hypothetical protein